MADETKRAHPRATADISATIRLPDGRTHSTGHIRNISLGGVFIEMDNPLGFGAELDLEFKLPAGTQAIRCRGLVMWNTKTQEGYPRPGMGVRLMQIGVHEMRLLADYIDTLLKR